MRPATCVYLALHLSACASRGAAPLEAGAAADAAPAPYEARPWDRPPPPPPLDVAPSPRPAKLTELRLSNGLRLLVLRNTERPLVSTRLYLAEGSLTDPPGRSGATFIAVAMLGERYEVDASGRPLVEEKSLRRMFFEGGARYDFRVDHDYAWIGVDGYAADLDDHLKALSAAVRRPRRGEGAFDGYLTQLVHRAEAVEPEDARTFEALLTRAAFGARHPYSRSPGGREADLRRLGYRDALERQDVLLDPKRSTLVLVGRVKPALVKRVAEATMGRWQPARRPGRRRPVRLRTRAVASGEALGVALKAARLVTACAARPVAKRAAPANSLETLAGILGEGIGSRLYHRLRERLGASYAPQSWVVDRRHARALIACTRAETRRAGEALKTLRATIDDLRVTPPSPSELARVRAIQSARERAAHSSVRGAMATLHRSLARDRPFEIPVRRGVFASAAAPAPAAPPRPAGVEEIRRLADRIMRAERWRIVLTGPPRAMRAAARQVGLELRPFRP